MTDESRGGFLTTEEIAELRALAERTKLAYETARAAGASAHKLAVAVLSLLFERHYLVEQVERAVIALSKIKGHATDGEPLTELRNAVHMMHAVVVARPRQVRDEIERCLNLIDGDDLAAAGPAIEALAAKLPSHDPDLNHARALYDFVTRVERATPQAPSSHRPR